jgi:hypothetical protein
MQLCFEPSNGGTVVSVQVACHLQGQLLRAGARDSAETSDRFETRAQHSKYRALKIITTSIITTSNLAPATQKQARSVTAYDAACKRTLYSP